MAFGVVTTPAFAGDLNNEVSSSISRENPSEAITLAQGFEHEAMNSSSSGETITVYATIEAENIFNDFILEPILIELPVDSTLADATLYALENYINNFNIIPAPFIVLGIADIDEGHLGGTSMWLPTVNHQLPIFEDMQLPIHPQLAFWFGGLEAQALGNGDVIRFRHSEDGWGYDFGIICDIWGQYHPTPSFIQADKSDLIRALFADDVDSAARQAALDIIIDPFATADDVKDAIVALETSQLEWAGSGTAQDPFLIGNREELMLLAERVNSSPAAPNSSITTPGAFYSEHFRLTNDIVLGTDWEPIGRAVHTMSFFNPNARNNGRDFDGIFDGNGHTITFAHGSQPLFGAIWVNAEIRNVNIYGPYIAGHGLIAGVNSQVPFGNPTRYPIIDNVTIISGTTIRGSGISGTDGFRPQHLDIRNSTIEAGVRIGFDADADLPFDQSTVYFANTAGTGPGVGSFVSGLAGSITNSVSYATVYGHANVHNVGGLVGYKQQSMRSFQIDNSHFHGEIIAPESFHVGGILGAGYDSPNPRNQTQTGQLGSFFASPNTPGGNISNSTATGKITGYRNVGGIVGGEFANQMWSTGAHQGPQHIVLNNHFSGTLIAMESNTRNIGGIFGYVRSLNRNNLIADNTFDDTTGATRGIGHVSIIDTVHNNPIEIADTIYFSTEGTTAQNPNTTGFGGITRRNYYRMDDPLGVDADVLARMIVTTNSVDRTTLNVAIAEAESRAQANYTPNSWTNMQIELNTAREVRDDLNSTQTQVDAATNNLNLAIDALVLVTVVNRAALNNEIARAEALVQANFTPLSWSNMQAVFNTTRQVAANTNATQPQVDTATNNLRAAIDGLVIIANRVALNLAIVVAEAHMQLNYTTNSWQAMQMALNTAIQVRNNLNSTQLDVDTATNNLNLAINGLVSLTVNRTLLNAAIVDAERIVAIEGIIPTKWSGWSTMTTALTSARAVNSTSNATQADVNLATTALENAINALVGTITIMVYNPTARQGDPSEFLTSRTITIRPGETAYSVLHRSQFELTVRSTGHHVWTGMYVEAINNWGEFDGGPLSGWMYAVNRVLPDFSASLFVLNPTDVLHWLYTYELGNDLVPRFVDANILGVDRSALRAEIALAESHIQANYTSVSWAPFQTALAAAIQVYNRVTGTQDEINTAINNLRTARESLIKVTNINRAALNTEIARAEGLNFTNYTAASWALVHSALTSARAVRDNANATQTQIDAATSALRSAINALVRIGATNFILLNNEIAHAEARMQANYTSASWQNMQVTLIIAKQVRHNVNSTQNEVNNALNSLRLALNSLVRVSGVNVTLLSNEIARAEARIESHYTGGSWAIMQSALRDARAALNSANSTQTQVNQATESLASAINALVRVSTPATSTLNAINTAVSTSTEIEAVTASNGTATVVISETAISELITKARTERATNIEVRLNIQGEVSRIETELTIRSIKAIVSDGISLTINSDLAVITLDSATLAGIAIGEDDNTLVQIISETIADLSTLSQPQQAVIGNNMAIRLEVLVGETYVNNFNGTITTTMSYTPSLSAEYHDFLTVYYIDTNGNIREMLGSSYSGSQITFMTNHFSVFFVSEWISPFADIARHDWHFRNVRFAYSQGIMSGTSSEQFSPNLNLSRAMMVTMLWRLEGSPIATNGTAFSDVQAGNWYTDAILWASGNGIINGFGDGTFAPNENITREQFAVILMNYAVFNGQNATGNRLLTEFSDASSISPWARDAVEWANSSGLITGRTITTLAPLGTATRAEAAAIMQRFIETQ